MKMLLVGADLKNADKVQLAVQLRWPEAALLVSDDLATGLELIQREAPEVVLLQDGNCGKAHDSLTKTVGAIRSCSDVPLIVLADSHHRGDLDEVEALEAGAGSERAPRSTTLVPPGKGT